MTAPAPYEPIVVGFDGSPASGTALRWAYEEAALRHACISAVMVVPLYPVAAGVRAPWDPAAPTRGLRAFERLVASIGRPGVSATLTVREGVPAAVLQAHAYRVGASLLVVGRRTRRRPVRMAFGSVGDALVRHPGGPVVVVVPEHAAPRSFGDRVVVGTPGLVEA